MSDLVKFTPGPWRWEYHPKSKIASLVGGSPQFDKTVMDFARVGLGSAGPVFRDVTEDGFNVLSRLVDKFEDWCRPIKGREHHKDWIQEVVHPDALLIVAAPELYAACAEFVRKVDCGEAKSVKSYAQMKAALAKAGGEEWVI